MWLKILVGCIEAKPKCTIADISGKTSLKREWCISLTLYAPYDFGFNAPYLVVEDLIKGGVEHFHFYTLNTAPIVTKVIENLRPGTLRRSVA